MKTYIDASDITCSLGQRLTSICQKDEIVKCDIGSGVDGAQTILAKVNDQEIATVSITAFDFTQY